jgi:hypothetical protein
MNYLFFGQADLADYTTSTGAVYPASSFLGLDPISATTTRLSFKAAIGTLVDDDVLIEHANGKHKEVAELIANALEPSPVTRDKLIVVANAATVGKYPLTYLSNGNGAGLTGAVVITTA